MAEVLPPEHWEKNLFFLAVAKQMFSDHFGVGEGCRFKAVVSAISRAQCLSSATGNLAAPSGQHYRIDSTLGWPVSQPEHADFLITNGKPLADMGGFFQFIGQRYGVVLKGDAATGISGQQLILA